MKKSPFFLLFPGLVIALLFHCGCTTGPLTPDGKRMLRVKSDFPGGSARILRIDQTNRVVHLNPEPYPDKGWDCWWYFKLEGIEPGETIELNVGNSVWATPDQAMLSVDNKTWKHTSPGERSRTRIVYRQTIDAKRAWFAWGPPFTKKHARELVASAARRSRAAHSHTPIKSRGGHGVPLVLFARPPIEGKAGVHIQARQHAWESGSSWVAKGLVDWLASDDPRAVSLLNKATISVVPIMDLDSVEMGAGGKNQKPQDHNRDWSGDPHWPEVRAAQNAIKEADEKGMFDLFIDLHNPAPGNRSPYFYVPPKELLSEVGRTNLKHFIDCATAEITGPLKFEGKTIESGKSYDPNWAKISKNWVALNTSDHVVAVTLETAWNTPNSTQEGYMGVGRELGMSIERYLDGARRPQVYSAPPAASPISPVRISIALSNCGSLPAR